MSEFEKKIAEYKNKINSCLKVGELDSLKLEVLGKNGLINLEFKKLSDLSIEEKKSFIKNILNNQISNNDIIDRLIEALRENSFWSRYGL